MDISDPSRHERLAERTQARVRRGQNVWVRTASSHRYTASAVEETWSLAWPDDGAPTLADLRRAGLDGDEIELYVRLRAGPDGLLASQRFLRRLLDERIGLLCETISAIRQVGANLAELAARNPVRSRPVGRRRAPRKDLS